MPFSYLPDAGATALAFPWWEAPEDADNEEEAAGRADSLIACAKYLEETQMEVHQQNLWNAQLYSNRELAAFDWGVGQLYRASLAPVARMGENLVMTVVDTLVSRIGTNRPKATPVARGADWSTRLAAKRLDKFLYGEFLRLRVYDRAKEVYRDAALFGFGALHVYAEDYADGTRVCIERVFPDELLIDQAEVVATGRPRHLYRRRVLPVELVAGMFGVDESELMAASQGFEYLDYRSTGAGWVVLVEGWQLDGRYMAAVHGHVLAEKPWDNDWFPFIFHHYQVPVNGFYSPSAVEHALNYQVRLNEINEVIRDAQDLMARPRLLVAEGSRVNPFELDNLSARIIKYTGIKPEVANWPAVSAELYNERDRIVATCLAQFGLNATSATAQAPQSARFDSSAAFREFNNIQDDRLSDSAQRYEQFFMDIAEAMVRVLKESGKDATTTWYVGGRKAMAEEIRWSEIDLDRDAYVLQLQPSSIFNLTPAGIRDEYERLLAQGLMSPEDYRLALAHPDLEGELSLQAASAADIERVIDLLEAGDYESPTPEQDLIRGVQRVTLASLNLRKYKKVPVQTKLNFTDWLAAARGWLEKGTEESPGAQAAAAAAPTPLGMQQIAGPAGPMAGMSPAMAPGGMAPPGGALPMGPMVG